jgi:hypothetical protein
MSGRTNAILALALAAVLAAVAFWPPRAAAAPGSAEHLWRALSWRAQLFLRKAEGGIPDLSWAELW